MLNVGPISSYSNRVLIGLLQGRATGTIYADDGHSFQYRKGKYVLSELTYKDNTLSARNVRLDGTGKLADADVDALGARVERIVVIGLERNPRVTVDGRELEVLAEDVSGGKKFVVKDPKVWIGREWEVKFT